MQPIFDIKKVQNIHVSINIKYYYYYHSPSLQSFFLDYDDLNVFAPMTLDKLVNPPVAMAAEGRVVMAMEADADLQVPSSEFKMKASVGLKR